MPSSSRQGWQLSVAALTDVGRQRRHNEDSIGYRLPTDAAPLRKHGALFVVCDGVGGSVAGEEASQLAVSHILSAFYQDSSSGDPGVVLEKVIRQANGKIGERNSQLHSGHMATTIAAAVIRGRRMWFTHAGDSRVYLIRRGQIRQLTQDHSWVAHMLQVGQLTPDEARRHPMRNHITRALGQEGVLEIETETLDLEPADTILLCSDGLTEYVPDDQMAQLTNALPLDSAAQRLIDLANERGGKDNISAILVRLGPPVGDSASATHRDSWWATLINRLRRRKTGQP